MDRGNEMHLFAVDRRLWRMDRLPVPGRCHQFQVMGRRDDELSALLFADGGHLSGNQPNERLEAAVPLLTGGRRVCRGTGPPGTRK